MVHRRWWFIVGVVVLSLGVTGLAGAQLPVPVPTPSVQTPVATAPLPNPPALPVPTPPAPVPTAPVPTPTVSVPSVSTPSVSTPVGSVPSASTPRVSTPASGGPAAAGSSPSGSARAAGSAAAGGSSPTASSAPGAGASGAGGQSTAGRSPGGATDNSPAAKVRRRDRALRRAVLRFPGCLSRVPRAERRVLTLRAGVGAARTHSRTEVARITHLRRARVIKLELRGLRRLHALARAGACQDIEATSMAAATGTGTTLPPGSTPGGRGSVLAEHRSSDSKDGGSKAQRNPEAELSISHPADLSGGGSFDLALVLAPLAVLAFLLVLTREIRRTRRPGT